MIEKFDIKKHSVTPKSLVQFGREISAQLAVRPEITVQLIRFKHGKKGQNSEDLGEVVSLKRILSILKYLKEKGSAPKSKYVPARTFQNDMKAGSNYFHNTGHDIAFVSKRADSDSPTSIVSVLSSAFFEDVKEIEFEPNKAFKRKNTQPSPLNIDEGDYNVPANNFYKLIAEVERRVSLGEPVFSQDGRYCAVPVETALKLKQHLFPERADIIVDTDTKKIANEGLPYLDSLIDEGKFIRVTRFKSGQQAYTIIPGALGEFLNLEQQSGLGIKPQKALKLEFNMRASVHTDFDGKLFIHLIPHQERASTNGEIKRELPSGFANVVNTGITSSQGADTNIMQIGDRNLALVSQFKQRLKHQDKNALHVDSDAHLSMTLNSDGSVSDLRLAFSSQRDIMDLAVTTASTVSLCINGRVYGLG